MPAAASPHPVLIRPRNGWTARDLTELWSRRELFGFLVWRDLTVRYKQTALGATWALLQPLAATAVFAFFFGRLAGLPSDGLPYPLFSFVGLLIWTYFVGAVSQCANSVINQQATITKVYFPRILLPAAAVVPGLLDLLIASAFGAVLLAYYGFMPDWRLLLAPLFVCQAAVTALGVGLWLSAVNVRYRDVRHAVPFLIQFWLFASPVAFASSLVPQRWHTLYALNPMVGVLEGFRWSVLGSGTAPGVPAAISALVSLAVLVSGVLFFQRQERAFADVG